MTTRPLSLSIAAGVAVVFGVLTVVINLGADLVAHRLAPRAGVAA
jgi:peptide/nickel transport system permease protein